MPTDICKNAIDLQDGGFSDSTLNVEWLLDMATPSKLSDIRKVRTHVRKETVLLKPKCDHGTCWVLSVMKRKNKQRGSGERYTGVCLAVVMRRKHLRFGRTPYQIKQTYPDLFAIYPHRVLLSY